jgi:hypothetical protein
MTVVGPLLLPYYLEYSSDTNVPESQGHQGPFSSCQGQMQSLIKLLIATICRKCESSRTNNDIGNRHESHVIVQQSSILS